jgi:Ni/Co efflux regulator RcnB
MKYQMPAAFAVAMMLGLAVTAQADNDNDQGRRDRGSWNSHGRHDDRRDHRRHEERRYDDRRSDWRAHDRDDHRRDWRPDHRRDQRWDDRDHHRYSDYHRYPYYRSQARYRVSYYHQPHGYRYYSWRRGDRLPVAYYAPRYVIHDYGAYHLHRPPHGYHWVRVNNDVILAAITTGIVLQVVDHIFY